MGSHHCQYTLQRATIHQGLGLHNATTEDEDDPEHEEYVDCEPPPSSASDCTIIPDHDDVPYVDVEPPSPPPTARPTHIPPPLVWPTERTDALSPRQRHTDLYPPRSPRSPSSPLSPSSLRRHRSRAYRRTPTHRVFSAPTCASPQRETARLGPPKRAAAMPKPMVRQLTIDPRPPAYVSPPVPDSPTLGPAPRRVAGLGVLPLPPPLERTLSECPEGPLSPDEIPSSPDSLLDWLSRSHVPEEQSIDISPPVGGGSLATKLAGLRIALPDLSSLSGRALGLWGASESTSPPPDDEMMPPLRRMGPALGFRRVEIEAAEGGVALGGPSLEA